MLGGSLFVRLDGLGKLLLFSIWPLVLDQSNLPPCIYSTAHDILQMLWMIHVPAYHPRVEDNQKIMGFAKQTSSAATTLQRASC